MIVMFFGHPGAGKTTLARRFGDVIGVPAIDTDRFMTPIERAAVRTGEYTQAMRLANINRYGATVRRDYTSAAWLAMADGLPNNASRRYLLEQFPDGLVVLALVRAERALWERRLAARAGNPVSINVAEADAYVRANWEPVAADIPHYTIDNVAETAAVDAQLLGLYERIGNR